MVTYYRSLTALFTGLKLCFFNASIRKLALWPWAIGALSYVASLTLAYFSHPHLLHHLASDPSGFFSRIIYYGAWLLVTLLLLLASMLLSLAVVMIFAGVFQTAIARSVLLQFEREVPPEEAGVSSLVKETTRTVSVEVKKLFWLIPLMSGLFLVGLIPFFTPVAVICGAWLLAYQFVDIVLDIYKIGVRDRLSFAFKKSGVLIAFGLALSICWAIPFLGLFLAPAAAAGAAWLLSEETLHANIRSLSQINNRPTGNDLSV